MKITLKLIIQEYSEPLFLRVRKTELFDIVTVSERLACPMNLSNSFSTAFKLEQDNV